MERDESQTPQEATSDEESSKWDVAAGAGVGGLFAPFAALGAWVMDLEVFGILGVAVLGGAVLGAFVASPSN